DSSWHGSRVAILITIFFPYQGASFLARSATKSIFCTPSFSTSSSILCFITQKSPSSPCWPQYFPPLPLWLTASLKCPPLTSVAGSRAVSQKSGCAFPAFAPSTHQAHIARGEQTPPTVTDQLAQKPESDICSPS